MHGLRGCRQEDREGESWRGSLRGYFMSPVCYLTTLDTSEMLRGPEWGWKAGRLVGLVAEGKEVQVNC